MESDKIEFLQPGYDQPLLIKYKNNQIWMRMWPFFLFGTFFYAKLWFKSIENFILNLLFILGFYVITCYVTYSTEKDKINRIIIDKASKVLEVHTNGQPKSTTFTSDDILEVRDGTNKLNFFFKGGKFLYWKKNADSSVLLAEALKSLLGKSVV